MRGTLTKPAAQPISAPPAKLKPRHRLITTLGDGARAVAEPLAAFEHNVRIEGCVLKRWNSSNGDRYGSS